MRLNSNPTAGVSSGGSDGTVAGASSRKSGLSAAGREARRDPNFVGAANEAQLARPC